jgi:hypothetical protein
MHRGLIESHQFAKDAAFIDARRTANGLLRRYAKTGLPGRIDQNWKGMSWSCLTGSLQVGCWLMLYHSLAIHGTEILPTEQINMFGAR